MDSILLVEDSTSFAALFQSRVQQALNIEIILATSFAETRQRIEEQQSHFSLVILGLCLPDAPDGEALDYLLAKSIPTVVLTGTFRPDLQQNLLKKGVLDYFVKDNIGVIDTIVHAIDRFHRNKHVQILVVDDSRSAQAMLCHLLARYGFQARHAKDGREALAIIAKHAVHLVISDYQMPNMDGIQMIKKLRTRYSRDEMAVIGLSSVDNKALPIQFIKSGANDFLIKPYQPEELLCRVYQNVDMIERYRELGSLLERHESVLAHALDAIITTNSCGEVVDYNPAAETLFGFPKQMVMGQLITDFIVPEEYRHQHQAALSSHTKEALQQKQLKRRIELPGLRVDGKVIDLQLSLTSVIQQNQPFFTAFIQDITDKKQLLKSMEETLSVAEAANRAKSEFIANMSHEIRTPMNAVLGFADLALKSAVSPRVHDYLEKIENASRALMGIINDILDFSKIEVGLLTLDPVKFDLQHLFDHLADLFSKQVADKHIELTLLAPVNFDEVLYGDVMRIEQILINLIRNAIKFTEMGSISVTCTPEMSENKKVCLFFSVKDTGIGIEQEKIDDLFAPFVQADGSTTRKYGGTGLGLSICKRLVKLMDGSIWAESMPGAGSEFTFIIHVQHYSENHRQSQAIPELFWGKKVLLVDDNPMVQQQVGSLLRSLLLNPVMVSSGSAALQALQQENSGDEPYEFVLIDWQMPEKDGVTTATEILATLNAMIPPATIPTLMLLTAFGVDAPRLEAAKIGVTICIDKPVTSRRLLRTFVGEMADQSGQKERRSEKILGHEYVTGEKVGGSRVLLVEDNEINLQIAQEFLVRVGIVVDCASHGREALEKLNRYPYDAVLMDIQMPVMDGLEATRRIRKLKRFNNLPIIAMTAHTLPEEIKRCLEVGMNAYLDKPIRSERLYGLLSKWIATVTVSPVKPHLIQEDGEKLVVIEGIDLVEGLERVSGNVKLFEILLARFHQDFCGSVEQIRQDLHANNLEAVSRQLHTLKGVSANIGASTLASVTERFERVVEQGSSEDRKAAMATFANKLNAIIDGLAGLSGIMPSPSARPTVSEAVLAVDLDAEQIAPFLRELFYHVERNSIEVQQTLERLQMVIQTPSTQTFFAELQRQIEDYNFEEASEVLQRIAEPLMFDLAGYVPPKAAVERQRVLVVDDQRSNVDLLKDILSDYDRYVALDGQQALKVANAVPAPDIILLDIMMPEMNGYEVCRRLKRDPNTQTIPVIFVTAKKEVEDEDKGFEAGGVDYITKPFNADIIRRRIITHLELQRHQNHLENLVKVRTAELAAAKKEADARKEAAEAGTLAKSNFLAHMSHEIRTPLNAILGMAELLQETSVSKEQRQFLDTSRRASEVLQSLINDILDLSKIEEGQMILNHAVFKLGELVNDVIAIQKNMAMEKGIDLRLLIDPNLPDEVFGDADRLKQVLLNLVNNAVKFTLKGEVSLQVVCRANQSIQFVVTDSGIGMSPEQLVTIFQPFVQADASTTRRFGGTGLGLTICKRLVDAMQGTLNVESIVDQGSTVRVEIPFAVVPAQNLAGQREAGQSAASLEAGQSGMPVCAKAKKGGKEAGMAILVVDDAPENLLVIKGYLKKTAHRIMAASNGEEAFTLFKSQPFDIVFMDMFMPVMDGYQATRAIRAWEKEQGCSRTTVVALTAQALTDDHAKTQAAGCDLHLTKPLRKARLLDTLKQFSR